jgi:hypothetical protein
MTTAVYRTGGVYLADRLARLDGRLLPARWLQRPPDEAAHAGNEIKIGLVGLVGSGILAVATGHWGLLCVGGVFLIAGLVRRNSARATSGSVPSGEVPLSTSPGVTLCDVRASSPAMATLCVLATACSSQSSVARPAAIPTRLAAPHGPALIDPGAVDAPPNERVNGSVADYGVGSNGQLSIGALLLCTVGSTQASRILAVEPYHARNLIVLAVGTRSNPAQQMGGQLFLGSSSQDSLSTEGFDTRELSVPPCAANYLQLPSTTRGTVELGLTLQMRGFGRATADGFRITYRLGGRTGQLRVVLPVDLCHSGDSTC